MSRSNCFVRGEYLTDQMLPFSIFMYACFEIDHAKPLSKKRGSLCSYYQNYCFFYSQRNSDSFPTTDFTDTTYRYLRDSGIFIFYLNSFICIVIFRWRFYLFYSFYWKIGWLRVRRSLSNRSRLNSSRILHSYSSCQKPRLYTTSVFH